MDLLIINLKYLQFNAMLDLVFKNILRQRTRTFLTILGIVIGIAAVVGLGSFAEGLNHYITASLELAAGKILVHEKGSEYRFCWF